MSAGVSLYLREKKKKRKETKHGEKDFYPILKNISSIE